MRLQRIAPVVFFAILSGIIISIWFSNGKMFATAEDSMPFYSFDRSVELYSHVWQRVGPGRVLSFGFNKLVWLYLSGILGLFLENVVVQALTFFFLIFSGMTSAFLLTKKLFKNTSGAFMAGLFYFLNLYTMSQVLHRSIYVGMFSWAYFPLFILLIIKFLEEGKFKNLLALALSTIVYIWAFGQPGFLFIYALSAVTIFLNLLFVKKNIDFKSKVIFRSIFGLIFLVAVNTWWIYPYVTLSRSTFAVSTPAKSFESLEGVSKSFPITQILLLKQKFFFDTSTNPTLNNLVWGDWYEGIFANLLVILAFAVAVYGLYKAEKGKYWRIVLSLGLLGIIVSKGANPPFGKELYEFLFTNFSFTSALRNPYEKFGLVWVLPYSVFFGLGLTKLFQKAEGYVNYICYLLAFLTLGVLVWPMWTGDLFPDYSWVNVPSYYEEANEYLKNDASPGRILMLPVIPSHGLNYYWGYRGDDPSRFLFDKVVVSKLVSNPYYANIYNDTRTRFENKDDIEGVLDQLNIKYLILRRDVDWELTGAQSPHELGEYLRTIENMEKIKSLGKLTIYKYVKDTYNHIEIKDKKAKIGEYTFLSPVHYKVSITNFETPYELVFKETYDDNWEARISGEKIKNHYLIYDYANAWKIDRKGSYTVDIVFKVWPWD